MRIARIDSAARKIVLSQNGYKSVGALFTMVLLLASPALFAQTSSPEVTITHPSGMVGVSADNSAPLTITLQDALERARANDPSFHSALTDLGVAREDRVQSRAGLLPSVSYNNSFIYTEGSGQPAGRFVANNGVHEYISQANVHQSVSLSNMADYRRSSAAWAQARAKAEIATRGLVVTVTQAY